MSKRVAVLTSGGDAPGMNACIRAIVIACERQGFTLFGYQHGYNGLLEQEYEILAPQATHNLIQQGGTVLHSARCEPFKTDEGAKTAATNLTKLEVDTLIVIGGDGSFRGADHLADFWHGQIIGIPGTIDNDVAGTDATIGYYTAIDTVVSSIDKVRDTADAFERIFIVEVMGRHAGFLALNSALASAADYVILPETFDQCDAELDKITGQIEKRRQLKGAISFIIVVAENVWPGGLNDLANKLVSKTQSEVRPVTLGHVQRGGSPVSQDRLLATKLGTYAVSLVGSDTNGVMVGELNGTPSEIPLTQTWEKNKPLNPSSMETMLTIMNERY
ncbi:MULTISPECIES: ATP-dependent 6-phosphofructokinase [Alteromonas]|uniref:6-phosphofructokinase n=1 Tax=Alteromonas stellipolaris TaxID=233316 RepID=A0ABM5YK00_9ALTE|nr:MULTISPECIES: ATP-dependent 6-phosphofructokinase [Alteromonas]AMJ90809.1 ATP-dependent 6-phosphofructokinase [Alteromonas sp. Mac2]ALM90496.1 6-phosphofructokinase [Alteromonas stellipolaris LMG 21856]AMJ74515.1 ATP-dependent 6-phosphofructokinase [Alteromonas stellipolaris]AMJ86950.1 ATP-dependent 6-phosphofructokinase [Alteromonas sp. Mac1]ANB22395.1 ATP-dependent 6-phosphofructokinase [Alteromonas stellipolaris]